MQIHVWGLFTLKEPDLRRAEWFEFTIGRQTMRLCNEVWFHWPEWTSHFRFNPQSKLKKQKHPPQMRAVMQEAYRCRASPVCSRLKLIKKKTTPLTPKLWVWNSELFHHGPVKRPTHSPNIKYKCYIFLNNNPNHNCDNRLNKSMCMMERCFFSR